jgi:DNA replication protein DnaC
MSPTLFTSRRNGPSTSSESAPLADIGAEFLFQVISERAEKAALIVTTNLPFSEWTTVFPNPRLCKALLDRITDRAHIIETETESFLFRRTMERRKKKT